jgi:DNA (cytosine-5)-methyltransferase 1
MNTIGDSDMMTHGALSIEDDEMIVDLFAGLGGASTGISLAVHRSPNVAVNHSAHAIELHELNHPTTRHYCDDVRTLDPRVVCNGRRVGLLWLSPDCRHFSRAKGSAPVSESVRSLAWEAITWAKTVRPSVICLENVPEFKGWGPLDPITGRPDQGREGQTFAEFVSALRSLGYEVEDRVLCAADFGAPTTRRRLFMVARCDGLPIRWPEPTHGPGRELPWRTAAECIDWSIPCPSIFDRARPLAEATCRRIARGIARYVLQGKPFIVEPGQRHGRGQYPVDQPLHTITATPRAALCSAFLAKHYGGVVGQDLHRPIGTVTAVDHHSLVATHITKFQQNSIGQHPCSPLDTVMAGATRFGAVAAFLVHYYGSGGQDQPLSEPMHTVVTRARHGLVTVDIGGETYALIDIGLRMLQPRELARAQGFPDSYILRGTQRDQIARVGNSVCPPVAEALVRAQFAAGQHCQPGAA